MFSLLVLVPVGFWFLWGGSQIGICWPLCKCDLTTGCGKNKYWHMLAWCADTLYIRPMFNLNHLSIMTSTSTFEEITARGPIHEIVESERAHDLFIVTFADGSQANADYSTMARLCIEGVWSPLAKRALDRC